MCFYGDFNFSAHFCTKGSIPYICHRFLRGGLTKLLEWPVLHGAGGVQRRGKSYLCLEKWILVFVFLCFFLYFCIYESYLLHLQPVLLFIRGLFMPSIDEVCLCLCNVDTFVMQIVEPGSARAVHVNVGVHKVCNPIFIWRT